MNLIERFESKFIPEPNTGCWLWDASLDTGGYGSFSVAGTNQRAHRVSYEMYTGSIPQGLELDHKCNVRSCVNPDHLEPVTRSENQKRSYHRGRVGGQSKKTHCKQGHQYSGDNLYLMPNGHRRCKECHRQEQSRQRQKKRSAAQ